MFRGSLVLALPVRLLASILAGIPRMTTPGCERPLLRRAKGCNGGRTRPLNGTRCNFIGHCLSGPIPIRTNNPQNCGTRAVLRNETQTRKIAGTCLTCAPGRMNLGTGARSFRSSRGSAGLDRSVSANVYGCGGLQPDPSTGARKRCAPLTFFRRPQSPQATRYCLSRAREADVRGLR
jgi:hypothetical protein